MYEMSLEKRINAFIELGTFLKQFKNKVINDSVKNLNEKFYDDFEYAKFVFFPLPDHFRIKA